MRRVPALLGLLLLLLPGPAARAAPPGPVASLSYDARERFTAALGALRLGTWETAAAEFGDPAWAATPLDEYARLFHAQSLLGLGDAAGARVAAGRVAATGADAGLAPGALLEAAGVLANAGDPAAAAAVLRRFLGRHPDHPEAPRARYTLGELLLAAGQPHQAAHAWSDLAIHAPASSYAEGAVQQLRFLGEQGVAVPSWTQRQKLERAERLLIAGLAGLALAEAEALAAEATPAEVLLRALRVVLDGARRVGREEAAAAAVTRALAATPAERRAPWLLEQARLLARRSRELAFATIDRLVREHPRAPEAAQALLLKARLFEGASQPAEAERVYARLAADYPEEGEAGAALWRLGWMAWQRGAWEIAAARWGRIVTVKGGRDYREAATYWAGRAQEQRGDAEAAARHWAQLLAEAPRSYYGLLAGRRLGRPAKPRAAAVPVALPADPLDPLRADARFARVAALRGVGLQEWADEEMEDMTRRAWGDASRLYALSAAYAQEARYHLALRILGRHFGALIRGALGPLPRHFWETLYPLGWRVELEGAAGRAALDPFLVAALVREESSFHPRARSRVGARGLMQLMPETARPLAEKRGLAFDDGNLLDDPSANLEMGTGFFGRLLREFGDERVAAAAYNAGPGRVRQWLREGQPNDLEAWVEQIPFAETRGFVKRVMRSWEEYRRVYGQDGAQP